ncbi:MAG: DNA-methyltransferase [Armatimonadota bacterium]
MAVYDQLITEQYAVYNADSREVMRTLPDRSIHLSVYSPPFASGRGGLYTYSSHERDLSNCDSYEQFLTHYAFFVQEIARLTPPGRITAVHCMDVPRGNSGKGGDTLIDFPGDIVRLHEQHGFGLAARHYIWKEPLTVRNRTMQKNLAHMTLVTDSTLCGVASADQLLILRKEGDNPIPVAHPTGLLEYAGARTVPAELQRYRGWTGKQTENRYSHWIWRQYASSFWDDIRIDRVLPYREARDSEDEKHVHPLQRDVIHRAVVMYSNPGETVLSPFAGVGSEVYEAIRLGRRGIGIELKPSYYRQMIKNLDLVDRDEGENEVLDLEEEWFGEE